ncbi:MAG: OmpH family outer membrane protein [Pseudomonadota bacterium]
MRNNLLLIAAAGTLASIIATPVSAQRATVLIVDTDRILNECTACKAAGVNLQGQVSAGRTRAQQLATQWQTEETALRTAVAALAGKQPDAALQARIKRYETSRQQGQTELSQKESQLQSIQANVQQQIGSRIVLISEQVRARRQADIVVGKSASLASNPANDVTAEVLAALNQQLPAVSVTPLPQQQQQAAPSGR